MNFAIILLNLTPIIPNFRFFSGLRLLGARKHQVCAGGHAISPNELEHNEVHKLVKAKI